jgi:transcriptional regulator with XRE-family HTH domain
MLLTVYKNYPKCVTTTKERELMKHFGRRVAEVRKRSGVTQQELAETINMSVVAIAYIETGKRWARLGTLDKIARSLKVPIGDLFKGL